MKKIFTTLILLSATSQVWAQVPTYTTPIGSGSNSFPFNSNTTNKLQGIYTPTDFGSLPPSGYISSVFFRVGATFSASTQVRTSNDVRIAMGYVPITDFSTTSTFFTGLDTVYYAPTRTYTALTIGDWVEFPLQTPFYYDNTLNLLVQGSTANSSTNQGFTIRNVSIAFKRLYGAYTATTGTAGTNLGEMGLTMTPLAINLEKFDAEYVNGVPHLMWSTAVEENASHFELERSYNGRNFEVIGKVDAKGRASAYSYGDYKSEVSGNVYYRLGMVDLDKSLSMSKTVILKPQTKNLDNISMHPNPSDGILTISLPAVPKGAVEVVITDAMGKVVLSRAYKTTNQSIIINGLGSLIPGIYSVGVSADGKTYKDKLLRN